MCRPYSDRQLTQAAGKVSVCVCVCVCVWRGEGRQRERGRQLLSLFILCHEIKAQDIER